MEQQKPKAKNYGYKWGLIALAILTIITAAVVTWDRLAVNEDLEEIKDELEKVSQVDTTETKSPVKIDTPTKVAETEKAVKDSLTTTENATAENTTAVKDSLTTTENATAENTTAVKDSLTTVENTTAVKDSLTTMENVPALPFTETFGGEEDDRAYAVQQTTDGGYIIAGRTESFGAGDYDFYLVKTDEEGNEEWYQTFGGEAYDIAYAVQQTTDGGYIIAGSTNSFGAGDYDFYLVKTDGEGNEEWSRTFGGVETDQASSVQQTADGGYIIAGRTESFGAGDWDAYLVKTDEEGNEEWYQTFGGEEYDAVYSVQQTADGGYIIAGYTESFGAGGWDAYLVKTDGEGNEEWYQTFGGEEYDAVYSVQQTADGGYIIAGDTTSFGAGSSDAYLVKTDEEGNEEWYRTFGGVALDAAFSVQQTADGGYIIAGRTESFGAGSNDAYLVKTDGEGVVEERLTVE